MPEPKKKKRTFESQAQTSLQGMQIMPQAGRIPPGRNEASLPDHSEGAHGIRPAESSLVEKLIDFIKSMD